jgi:hypothetical protein
MTNKITAAVQRLSAILPLQNNLTSLDTESKKIYHAIQQSYLTQGRAPTLAELNTVSPQARASIGTLSEKDMLVSNAQGEIIGAYPFTSEIRKSRVEINGHTVYAMCALDALAPAAMAQCKSRVVSECAVTRQAIIIELDNQKILNTDDVGELFVGINWQAARSATSCATSLCTEMIFLKGEETALQWQAGDSCNREFFTLPEAVQFSAEFFVPLVDSSER